LGPPKLLCPRLALCLDIDTLARYCYQNLPGIATLPAARPELPLWSPRSGRNAGITEVHR
jgi:hypothetical protein